MNERDENSVSEEFEELQAALDDAKKTLRELQSQHNPKEPHAIKQMLEKKKQDNLPDDLQAALDDAKKTLRELQSKRSPEEQRAIKQMLEKRKRKQGA